MKLLLQKHLGTCLILLAVLATSPAYSQFKNNSKSFETQNNVLNLSIQIQANNGYSFIQTKNSPVFALATTTTTLNAPATPPLANPDSYSTDEDNTLSVSAALGLLNNDSDPDGDNLSVSLIPISQPSSGSLTLNADGSFDYIPDSDFNGVVTFEYEVCDDALIPECSSAIVTITVNAINDAPIPADDTAIPDVTEDVAYNGASVLANDFDADLVDILSVNTTPVLQPSRGTLTLNSDGTYLYTPQLNYFGPDAFTYQVCDNGVPQLCDFATVDITVVAVPDAPLSGNDSYSTNEDIALNGTTVLANDTEPDGENLIITTTPITPPSNGTLSIFANGTFLYTPTLNYNGPDSFVYEVCDDAFPSLCSQATVSIVVNPINDFPLASNDVGSTNEDIQLLGSSVLANDTDPDGHLLSANTVPVINVTHGTLSINSNGTYVYTPTLNYTGPDFFVYTVCDDQFPAACSDATVNITVNAINDAPLVTNDVASTNEDITLNGASVLLNDSDPEGNALTVTTTPITDVLNGSLTLNANGTFIYIPDLDFFGSDSFVYEVCDDGIPSACTTGTVTITVNSINDAPLAQDDGYSVGEDVVLNGTTVLINDNDPDGNNLSVTTTPVTAPLNGNLTLNTNGTFTYTPNLNYSGPDSFVYQVCDDGNPVLCANATVSINVSPINDAPLAQNDNATIAEDFVLNGSTVLANDSDPDGNALTVNTVPLIAPTHGVLILNSNGTYSYTPSSNYNGTDSFVYEVCDNAVPSLCATATVNITITPLADAPIAQSDNYTISEDAFLNGITVLNNDFDGDGDMLSVNTTPVSNVANGVLVLNSDGTFLYFPNSNFSGSDSFEYEVCDATSLCATATVIITVNSVNDVPLAVNDIATINEDNVLNGSSVLLNDSDIEGHALSVTVSPLVSPSNGILVLNSNGTYTYTPNLNFNGNDSFTYQVCDNGTPSECASAVVNITVNAINDPPLAANDIASTNEDSPLNGSSLLTNDSDVDGNTLTINTTPVSNPTNGTLVINTNGTYLYTPNANFNGTDSFVYRICDDGTPSSCANANVTIAVNSINDVPNAVNDVASTSEDNVLLGASVLLNDIDPEGHPLTVSTIPLLAPLHGTLNLNSNGTYTYTPALNYTGPDSFIYEVCDNEAPAGCSSATVFITITPVNDAPSANADNYSTNEDTPLNGSTVLINDIDVDNNPLTVNTSPIINPANGILTLNSDGTFSYIPNLNYSGTDSFTYEVCDNQIPALCSTAIVAINVNPINDSPIALNENYSTSEDVTLFGASVLGNDSDPDGNPLLVTTTPLVNVSSGNLILNSDGTFTYTPVLNFNGTVSFVYEVCDNAIPSLCTTATATIDVLSVNDAPVANSDTYSTNEDTPLNGTTVLTNDNDPDLNTLVVNTIPFTSPIHGNLVLNANGTFTYTPFTNYNGPDSFVYEICDNGVPSICATGTVTITIQSVNDTPIALDDNGTTLENVTLNGSTVLANDNDPENGTLTVNIIPVTNVAHGTLTLNANGTYTYIPNFNYNGFDFFVYQVCDNGIPSACATATVTISIGSVNQFPNAVNDLITTNEDTPNSSNVLTNDTDPDMDALTVTVQTNFPTAHGTITIAANGAYTYTPNSNYNGPDSYTYQVCDNGSPALCSNAILTINVSPVNDPPVAANDNVSGLEDSQINGASLLLNDSDIDGNPLTVTVAPLVAPNNGTLILNANGTYTYTPNLNYVGGDIFVYEVCDNGMPPLCSNAVVLLTISAVNDAPTAGNDSYSINEDVALIGTSVLVNDFDQDGNTLQVSGVASTPPANGNLVLNANGTFIYTPNPNFNGTDSFVYQVCDNGVPSLCSNATVTITINAINDAPIALPNSATTSEDTQLTGASLLINDSDVDGNLLTINTVPAVNPLHGTVLINLDGTYIYTPALNYNGPDSFIYQICDNGTPVLCATAIVSLTVSAVNDAPIALNDAATTNEDTPLNGTTVLSNDTDPDGNALSATTTAITLPANGSLTLNTNGTYSYIPNTNFNGSDSFVYEVCDNGTPILCNTATVTITINAVNDPPLALNDNYSGNEDSPLIGTSLLLNDSDPESGLLVVNTIPVTLPANGTLTINLNGTFLYTPNLNFNGSDSFTYQVCDAGIPVGCSFANAIIVINPINDAPVAQDDNGSTLEDTPLIGANLLLNDNDPDNNPLTINTTPVSNPTNGFVVINSNGTYTYTPNLGYSGFDSFEYSVCDNGNPALCDIALVTIGIGAVNHAPDAQNDLFSTLEDTNLNASLATNDSDPDGNILSYTAIPVIPPANGMLTINANGTFTYVPNLSFFGSDSFTYQVCDDGVPSLCATATANITIFSVNQRPFANPDFTVTLEDLPLLGTSLLNNDIDPDGNNLSINTTPAVPPTNGILLLNTNGTYSYTPNADFNGTDSFVYQLCDDGSPSLCDTAFVTITIQSVNDAPLANSDNFVSTINTAINGDVTTNDIEVDGPSIVASILTNVLNGSLLFNNNGTFTYTPNTGFVGSDSLLYLLCDGAVPNLCDSAMVYFTISANPNTTPLAVFDSFSVNEDLVLNSSTSVLLNDLDVDGNLISINTNPVSNVSNGVLVLNSNGTFTYTPNSNFNGTDSFVYQICDDGIPSLCDTALVIISVVSINDAPVAINDSLTTLINTVVNGDVLLNDSDVDGPSFQLSLLTFPSNGTVIFGSNGSFSYTPNNGFIGTDSFVYSLCDGGTPNLCATATVFITVNPLPPNQAPSISGEFVSTFEDTQISGSLTGNDLDPEGSSLVYNIYSGPTANGTLAISASGNFIYVPNPNFYGTDTFIYTACDTMTPPLCDTATLSFSIISVNDAPIAVNDSANILQGTVASGNLLSNDSDVESTQLTATLLVQPINGVAVVNANGTYTYTPNSIFVGTDIFSYVVCDTGSPILCDTALVLITVNAPPCAGYLANADAVNTNEDFPILISVLTNDIFIPTNVVISINSNPSNGTLVLNANNTFLYTPNPNFNGTDTFIYSLGRSSGPSICDTALVTLNVAAVNDAPIATNDTLITTLGNPNSGNVLSNDADVDGPLLTATVSVLPLNGSLIFNANGAYTYTPNAGFLGNDTITYIVCDGAIPPLCDTAQVIITVTGQLCAGYTAVSDTATAVEDNSILIDVLSNDTVVLANVGVLLTSAPLHGTVSMNASHVFTYTPQANYFGSDSFIYAVVDSTLPSSPICDTAIVKIKISPVNDKPLAIVDYFSTFQGLALNDSISANDSDPENDTLIFAIINTTLNGSLTFNANGTFNYVPNPSFFGIETFIYSACDNGIPALCDTAIVFINVLKVNKAPFAVDDAATVQQEEFVSGNVLFNDSDFDANDLISVNAISQQATHGNVIISADGNFTYTPDPIYFGLDSFAYEVCDDNFQNKLCDIAVVRITILETPLSIPNAFSPDGDNINDFFVIKRIKSFPESELKIYNRWGHMVYSKVGYDNSWDGKASVGNAGDGLPSGSYFYVLDLKDGNTKPMQGYIVLRK
jgi:gliding motility-associated-like protein